MSEKFWAQVDKMGPKPSSDKECEGNCWIWFGTIDAYGYGALGGKENRVKAHRFSYELILNEKIPSEICVCHKCDNPACVNPAHLFLGSRKENMHDMITKGRDVHVRGSANGKSKLKESDILIIRKLIKNGDTLTSIAKKFKVACTTIVQIRDSKTWKHVL